MQGAPANENGVRTGGDGLNRMSGGGQATTIVVFGATGNVGSHVLRGLLDHAGPAEARELRVRAVTRDPAALRARLGERGQRPHLELVKGELSAAGATEFAPIVAGAQRVFLCLPQALSAADMVAVSHALSDACQQAGVSHIVRISSARIDSYCLEHGGAAVPTQGPFGEAHVAGEAYTKEQGIGLTSIRPTSFHSNFLAYDLPAVKADSAFASPLGSAAAVNWVACRDIASVAVRALLDSAHDGRVLDVTGPPSSTLSAAQMQALLEAKCARPIRYTEVPPPPVAELQGLWAFLRAGGFDMSTSTVLDVTGTAPQDFSEFLDTLDLSQP